MKKYDIVIIVMNAAFLCSSYGIEAAASGEISSLNARPLTVMKCSPASLYTMLPADRAVLPGQAEPMELESPAPSSAAPEKVPTLLAYGRAFLPDIADGTKRIFSRDNVPPALIGLGLTGLAFTVDHRVQDYFQEKKPMEHQANIGNKIGLVYVHIGIGMAFLGAGELSENKKLADTGIVTLEALLVNGIATEGLKYASSRDRPNGKNDLSFPSGHASSTATLAASVSEMYDWDLRIAVPLYMATAFVGASRIQANEHHLSDVVAGVTLGTLVGTSFAKYHKGKNNTGTSGNLAVIPLWDGNYKGLVVQGKF